MINWIGWMCVSDSFWKSFIGFHLATLIIVGGFATLSGFYILIGWVVIKILGI